jgi:hypothetical protein
MKLQQLFKIPILLSALLTFFLTPFSQAVSITVNVNTTCEFSGTWETSAAPYPIGGTFERGLPINQGWYVGNEFAFFVYRQQTSLDTVVELHQTGPSRTLNAATTRARNLFSPTGLTDAQSTPPLVGFSYAITSEYNATDGSWSGTFKVLNDECYASVPEGGSSLWMLLSAGIMLTGHGMMIRSLGATTRATRDYDRGAAEY